MYVAQDLTSIDSIFAYPETLADAVKQKSGRTGFKNADNNDVWVVNSSKEVLSEAELEHTVERDGKLYYAPFVSISLKDGRALTLNCKTEEQANNVALYIQSKLGDNYMGLTDVIDYFDPEKIAERESEGESVKAKLKWHQKIFKIFTKKQV